MHMAPGEGHLQALRSQLTAPFLDAQDCIVNNFGCCFNVLQDTLQGYILTGNSCFHGLAMKCKVSLVKSAEKWITYEGPTLSITVKDTAGRGVTL